MYMDVYKVDVGVHIYGGCTYIRCIVYVGVYNVYIRCIGVYTRCM